MNKSQREALSDFFNNLAVAWVVAMFIGRTPPLLTLIIDSNQWAQNVNIATIVTSLLVIGVSILLILDRRPVKKKVRK